jgi:hypothetical protein
MDYCDENWIGIRVQYLNIALICLVFVAGCGQVDRRADYVYPVCERPFEECSVDPGFYKPVQGRNGPQDGNLSLAVAISGGGHRAANFGAGVLLGLEEIIGEESRVVNILSEIDYFSTVSGGGFAAGAYLSSLHDHLSFGGGYEDYSFGEVLGGSGCDGLEVECPVKKVSSDDEFTDPCIRRHLEGFYSNIYGDVIGDLFSWITLGVFNKGGHYEENIDDDVLGRNWRKLKQSSNTSEVMPESSLVLSDIFVRREDQREVNLPYWVANSTVYENGSIFAFTPDFLELYKICEYQHRGRDVKYDKEKSYESFIDKIPVSIGVAGSASFPVATKPITLMSTMDLDHRPYVHLFDGGVADNLGVITAVRLLDKEPSEKVRRKVLIVIDAYKGNYAPFSEKRNPPSIGKTALRVMDISLDSWRGRHKEIIRELCEKKGIEVVFLSFDDFAGMVDFEDLFDYGLCADDVEGILEQSEGEGTIFELLRRIPTIDFKNKGQLGPARQNLLLSAGRYVVDQKKEAIIKKVRSQKSEVRSKK